MTMPMQHRREVVRLYRQILKLAKQYPSVKREAIIEDIKLEFHECKALTDPAKVQEKLASARGGIRELAMYAGLNPAAISWAVDVGREAGAMPTGVNAASVGAAAAAGAHNDGVKVVGGNPRPTST